ncbi:hypothetical protein GUJ93_ZPchr0025g2910 [Zizania palustris]|uniref:Protein kinase domain-containing protein n=1 Tax=Zizania palustris TaxID=103762 RepID=A0A8J5QP62_ZIZPA|nr:hypothetical protein GUJ93_ZPchr0025g2910 [Zizania palustris]
MGDRPLESIHPACRRARRARDAVPRQVLRPGRRREAAQLGEDGYSTPEEIAHLRKSLEEVAAVWQNLDHPNITKFIGVSMGTSNLMIPPSDDDARNNGDMDVPPPDRACCVVVEFLTGGTLKGHLIKHMDSKLPYKEVVRFALAMARGLSRLHSRNIVHRDVKTENMLLDGELNLKIADFGVARLEQQDPREMTGTTGTLGYMAPEVLNGKPYNRSCDVYSFGICLWEMYCCDMPYADLAFTDASSRSSTKTYGRRSRVVVHPPWHASCGGVGMPTRQSGQTWRRW